MIDLFAQIVSCNDKLELHKIQTELDDVTKKTTAPDQPAYIQKLATDKLKILNNLLQSKQNQLSKKRFEFKGEPVPPISNSLVVNDQTVPDTSKSIQKVDNQIFEISLNEHMVVDCFSNSYLQTTNEIPSIHLKSGNRSICKLTVQGPVFIHDVENSILILSCHQARLHNIHNSLVVMESVQNNRIIIENCNQIKVNSGFEIDDFNFPTKEIKNPHFEVLMREKSNEVLAAVGRIAQTGDIETVINKYIEN